MFSGLILKSYRNGTPVNIVVRGKLWSPYAAWFLENGFPSNIIEFNFQIGILELYL